jgi:hypothetical protein
MTKKGGGMFDLITPDFMKKKSPTPTPATATPTTATASLAGGYKKKKYRGGYYPNTPLNNIASNASSYKGATAQPRAWVGGRSRKSRRSSSKKRVCKHSHHKTCKKH